MKGEFRESETKTYGDETFVAKMGAEGVHDALANVELESSIELLQEAMGETKSKQIRKKLSKRIKLFQGFITGKSRPEWMILTVLPVISAGSSSASSPLEGGRFATSDLNDLYRRVINRNNRLKNLLQLKTPEVIIRNEKRMLQEAVDALFDKRPSTVALSPGPATRPLKSLSDMLKGKSGRFRQNLLGKRVDYSGRSVIVVGPELKLNQCGLPKKMALVLFEPFHYSPTQGARLRAYRPLREKDDRAADLGGMGHLGRGDQGASGDAQPRAYPASALHSGVLKPVLIEGEALRIHPLVCTAYKRRL